MTRSLASTVTDIAEAGRAGRALFLTAAECRDLAGLIANGRVAEFRLAAHVVHFALESPADADFGNSLASQVRDLAPVIPSSLADRTVASGCEAVMDTAGGPDLSVVTDSPKKGPAETTAVRPVGVSERMSGRAVSTRSGGISGRTAGVLVTSQSLARGDVARRSPRANRTTVSTARSKVRLEAAGPELSRGSGAAFEFAEGR